MVRPDRFVFPLRKGLVRPSTLSIFSVDLVSSVATGARFARMFPDRGTLGLRPAKRRSALEPYGRICVRLARMFLDRRTFGLRPTKWRSAFGREALRCIQDRDRKGLTPDTKEDPGEGYDQRLGNRGYLGNDHLGDDLP